MRGQFRSIGASVLVDSPVHAGHRGLVLLLQAPETPWPRTLRHGREVQACDQRTRRGLCADAAVGGGQDV